MMKELLMKSFMVLGAVLVLLVLAACILYLAWCITTDAADAHDYFLHRTEFRMWKWAKEREAGEEPEVREQRILAELKAVREEMDRRDGRQPVVRMYTFLAPGKLLEHYF